VNLRRARDAEGKVLGDGPSARSGRAPALRERLHRGRQGGLRVARLDAVPGRRRPGGDAPGNQAMEQVKERFLDERMRGFRDTKGQYHAPMTREATQRPSGKAPTRASRKCSSSATRTWLRSFRFLGSTGTGQAQKDIYKKAATTVRQFLDYRGKYRRDERLPAQERAAGKGHPD
jgi:hypothetical protein